MIDRLIDISIDRWMAVVVVVVVDDDDDDDDEDAICIRPPR
jgi:hypothetical protein